VALLFSVNGIAVRVKRLLAVLLFLHVLVHPAVHAFPIPWPSPPAIGTLPDTNDSPVVLGLGPCIGCQTGSTLGVASDSAEPVPIPTVWERVSLPVATFCWQPFDPAIPARAPPLA
jgi:hypothetical protein